MAEYEEEDVAIDSFCFTHRPSAPFASHSSQTLGRPAGFLARVTLGTTRQIAFSPVMLIFNFACIFSRNISSTFFTICNCKVRTFKMYTIFTNFTSNSINVLINSSTTNRAKFSLQMANFSPTVRNWVGNYIRGDC